jgi:hypothetical protein
MPTTHSTHPITSRDRPWTRLLPTTLLALLIIAAAGATHAQNMRQIVPAAAQQERDKAQQVEATARSREARARACLSPASKPHVQQCEAELGYGAQAGIMLSSAKDRAFPPLVWAPLWNRHDGASLHWYVEN